MSAGHREAGTIRTFTWPSTAAVERSRFLPDRVAFASARGTRSRWAKRECESGSRKPFARRRHVAFAEDAAQSPGILAKPMRERSMSARVATVAVLTAAVSLGAKQDVWVASKMSPELWTRVRAVLEPELAPDDPAHTPRHAVALRYKRLVRVAGDEVVLALIGMRENERQPARSGLTAAYSVDLPSGRKELLGRYALWRFVKWAHFESHSADAVFSYQTCDECEAERFVASFTYDSNARAWKLRRWPEEATQILIGADPEPDAQADLRCL